TCRKGNFLFIMNSYQMFNYIVNCLRYIKLRSLKSIIGIVYIYNWTYKLISNFIHNFICLTIHTNKIMHHNNFVEFLIRQQIIYIALSFMEAYPHPISYKGCKDYNFHLKGKCCF